MSELFYEGDFVGFEECESIGDCELNLDIDDIEMPEDLEDKI